jgi:hypothetical protein
MVTIVVARQRNRHPSAHAASTATTATATAADGLQTIPAAVTAQLVSAAGTSRTSGVVATDGFVVTP